MTVRRLAIMVALLLICFGTAFHRAYAAPTQSYTAAQVFAAFHNLSPLSHLTARNAASVNQPPAPTFGEIETSKLYCVTGTTSCAAMSTPTQVSQVRYAEVALIYLNGVLSGRPDGIVLVCGRNFLDAAGNMHLIALHDFAGDAAVQAFGFSPGTFNATGYAQGNPTEATTRASSSMEVFSSTDTRNNTQGTASGYQITNNVTDTALLGGGSVSLSGQTVEISNPMTMVETPGPFSIMTCSTNNSAPAIPFFSGGPPDEDSEAVSLEDDGD